MKKFTVVLIIVLLHGLPSCDILEQIEVSGFDSPTETEIIEGLKEALRIGTQNGIDVLSRENGFYGNALLRIPFPPEARVVEEKLRSLGLNKLVDDFIVTMNRGAERAVQKAAPIFISAIKSMTITDAYNILHGDDNAATEYFRRKTSTQLVDAFKPDVKKTLDEVRVTSYWDEITTTYNNIPFTRDVETDLPQYVTEKAVDGLFIKIEEEEKQIREDPAARVTEILRKVFGSRS